MKGLVYETSVLDPDEVSGCGVPPRCPPPEAPPPQAPQALRVMSFRLRLRAPAAALNLLSSILLAGLRDRHSKSSAFSRS